MATSGGTYEHTRFTNTYAYPNHHASLVEIETSITVSEEAGNSSQEERQEEEVEYYCQLN